MHYAELVWFCLVLLVIYRRFFKLLGDFVDIGEVRPVSQSALLIEEQDETKGFALNQIHTSGVVDKMYIF